MDSSYQPAPSEHTPTASDHHDHHDPDSAASPPDNPPVDSPLFEPELPPSPSGLDAAVILTTLVDSRPSISYGEDEEELEDYDDTGGISLVAPEHGETATTASPSDVTSGYASSDYSGQDLFSLGNPQHLTAEHLEPTFIDHAAQLASLSIGHVPTPPSSTAPATISGPFQTPGPTSGHALELAFNPYEHHLKIQDTLSFLDIANFFDLLVVPPTTKEMALSYEHLRAPDVITREDLAGDQCDYQGFDWRVRGSTRAEVRAKKMRYEEERIPPRIRQLRRYHGATPNTENFFSFRRMNTTHYPFFSHFQLRNMIAATSRNDIYYARPCDIVKTDASASPAQPVMHLRCPYSDPLEGGFSTTTIAAADNVLIAGAFHGEYAITDLSSTYGTPFTQGLIRDYPGARSRIVNHIHLFKSRATCTPQAVLCSNDDRMRILDCATNTFTHTFAYPAAVNCSATSPDGRLRAVVGDFQETLITNAETGRPFETLSSHVDDVFACAWADDSIHVATAAQDSTIVVWDARYWRRPLSVMHSELSVPRTLRFSPVGSGPRVLVSAEADDFVSIINAQTWESKQTFDFFGASSGVDFSPDGQSLFVTNVHPRFGGLIELERTGWAEKTTDVWAGDDGERGLMSDWVPDQELDRDSRVLCGEQERERRNVDFSELVV